MKRIIVLSTITLALAFAGNTGAEEHSHGHETHAPSAPSSGGNALKQEMRLLDAAFKNLLDAIVLDTPETIEAPFHKVHMAKMATEEALHAGKVTLPKNGDKLEEFASMDEAFHDKLGKLLNAAGKKDRKGIEASAHDILDGCVRCHEKFRK